MSKYKMTNKTLDDVRASKSFMLIIPDHATPDPPEGGWKTVDKESKQGPWKWDEQVRVQSTSFTEGEGMDRLTFKVELLEGVNVGRIHNETCFLRPMGSDGNYDQMTSRSFAKIDEFIVAGLGEGGYLFDDDGDRDPLLTCKESMRNIELRVRFAQSVQWRKKNKQWCEDVSIDKIYGDDDS